MIRSVASKAMWVGRTTAAVIGLAIALAVVFGVATMALAAVPGDPFKLGKVNSINKVSNLVGSVTGPLLKVDNNGGGPALSLEANSGKPPLVVNAAAGKARNLNADKLDNKDSTEFADAAHDHDGRYYSKTESDGRYLGKTEKAADSDKLDGQDSTALLPGGSLPYGRTMRGNYDIRDYVTPAWQGTALGVETSAISFGYRLSSTPAVRIIKAGATPPAQCPGTTAWPQAAPGYLCVYEYRGSSNMSGHPFAYNVTRNGASLYAHLSNNSNTNAEYYTYGTWAVTGN